MELETVDMQARRKPAEDSCPVIAGQSLRERCARRFKMRLAPAIGAAGPISAVEQFPISRDRFYARQAIGCAEQAKQLSPARRGADQLGNCFEIVVCSSPRTRQDVHRIAQLLEDGVVRNGPDLPQAHFPVGRNIRLPSGLARTGFVQKAKPERRNRARVGA